MTVLKMTEKLRRFFKNMHRKFSILQPLEFQGEVKAKFMKLWNFQIKCVQVFPNSILINAITATTQSFWSKESFRTWLNEIERS